MREFQESEQTWRAVAGGSRDQGRDDRGSDGVRRPGPGVGRQVRERDGSLAPHDRLSSDAARLICGDRRNGLGPYHDATEYLASCRCCGWQGSVTLDRSRGALIAPDIEHGNSDLTNATRTLRAVRDDLQADRLPYTRYPYVRKDAAYTVKADEREAITQRNKLIATVHHDGSIRPIWQPPIMELFHSTCGGRIGLVDNHKHPPIVIPPEHVVTMPQRPRTPVKSTPTDWDDRHKRMQDRICRAAIDMRRRTTGVDPNAPGTGEYIRWLAARSHTAAA
jgi:hypothetical protein